MSYNNNTPQGTDLIRDTTDPIRTNFFELFTRLQNDHASINDADSLKRLTHDKVRLNVQVAAPNTSTSQLAVYNKEVSTAGSNYQELFLRRSNNGNEIQMTTGNLTPAKSLTAGYTFLPGGLVLMWGETTFINDAFQPLPQVNGVNVAKIYSLQMQVKFYLPTPIVDSITVLIQGIDNTGSPATFKPRFLTRQGDNGFAKPTFYQAIVELVS